MIVLRDRKPGIVLLDPQGFATDSEVLEKKKKTAEGAAMHKSVSWSFVDITGVHWRPINERVVTFNVLHSAMKKHLRST